MSRHIVHVADYGNPAPGSFVPAIVALANDLHLAGDRCSLIVKRVDDAVWHEAAARNLHSFAAASTRAEVFRLLRREAPDVVHVHFAGWSFPATAAAYTQGARVIWHLHSSMENGAGRLRRLARAGKYNWFGAGVHRFVVVSDSLRRAMIDMGISPKRVKLLRNAVDTAHFRPPSAQERRRARETLGIAQGDRVVLYFGRDIDIKGADILWEALDGSPPVVLLGVGLPPRAVAEFSARVPTIALPFVADVAPLYWAADLLAMPSRREAAPYTMLEALCSGLPVIASNIAPLAEIAAEAPRVLLVSNDPATFARALSMRFERHGVEVEAVRARFGLDRWVEEMRRLYAA
jgi:glycosyltransferase involved in cell wall biosynthesis